MDFGWSYGSSSTKCFWVGFHGYFHWHAHGHACMHASMHPCMHPSMHACMHAWHARGHAHRHVHRHVVVCKTTWVDKIIWHTQMTQINYFLAWPSCADKACTNEVNFFICVSYKLVPQSGFSEKNEGYVRHLSVRISRHTFVLPI